MSTSDDVRIALNAVNDQETFLLFVQKLSADWKDEVRKEEACPSPPFSRGANGWENGSIDTFLDAAAAWAESTDFGISQGGSPDNL
jgi:hypothetical protein